MPDWKRRAVWFPPSDAWAESRMGVFLDGVAERRGLHFSNYDDAWRWSVTDIEAFWRDIADEFDVALPGEAGEVLTSREMPGGRWFPGSTLNYARELLEHNHGDQIAIIGESQSRDRGEVTFSELRQEVARVAAGLGAMGVRRGDRVVAYLPNCPEAVVAFLACASIGAVWSSCGPEFGAHAVISRFIQIRPAVMLTVTGFRYGSKSVNRLDDIRQIVDELSTIKHVILLDYLKDAPSIDDLSDLDVRLIGYADIGADLIGPELTYADVPFEHPLYVLYSSGSTGLPKAIIHGHGGILLEHLKVLGLHHDIGHRDTVLWFSTTGWMMWNYLVSALALGATIVAFDGDPSFPATDALLRIAQREDVTVLGCGASYLMTCHAEGIPVPSGGMPALRQIGSTGSPLSPAGFDWVERSFDGRVQLVSVSGGTDVCTALVAGAPVLPVHRGEIACRCLGTWVDAFDEDGSPVVGSLGEMVIRAPMPSMPVGFWGDDDGARYRAAYFDQFPGVWRQGDWIEITPDGTCVITGRSDATLNRGGIRSGTAEYTATVEDVEGVADSLVVHVEEAEGVRDELLLLLALDEGTTLDAHLEQRIRAAIRAEISPRHVPDRIVQVPHIPRTVSGKKVEVPVKRLLSGAVPSQVVSQDAFADPSEWDEFVRAVRSLGLTA